MPTASPEIRIDYGSRGRVGLLLPSVNQAAEPQLRAMLPPDVAIATTRLELADSSDRALLGMANNIEAAAKLLADAMVDVIVFHCTAVSTYSVELEASILRRMKDATGLPALATSQSLVAALEALHARKIVMLSPYTEAVNQREKVFFEARGFEVLGYTGLNRRTAVDMMAVTPEQWIDLALKNSDSRADAYMMSCTTVRSAEAVAALEAKLDRPVITSNTAVAWHCMKQLRVEVSVGGYGRLLSGSCPKPAGGKA